MPPIVEDQRFTTLADFKEALREWAVEANFTPHILDSDKQRVRAGCRSSPDCPFRIRVNYNIKLRAARVTTVEGAHTCAASSGPTSGQPVNQHVKRSEVARLSFLIKMVPQLLDINKQTRPNAIIDAIEKKYGQRLLHRQAQKVRQVLCRKPCRHCHQFGHHSRRCPQRPADADVEQDADDDDDSGSEERPRRRSRCLVCFQTGHNRKNCPQKANGEAQNQDAAMNQHQLSTAAYAPNLPPNQLRNFQGTFGLEPILEDDAPNFPNNEEQPSSSTQQSVAPRGPFPPNRSIEAPQGRPNPGRARQQRPSAQPRPSSQVATSQPPRTTPQSLTPPHARVEAARLMQQAASLMQEAARLNFEAARLTASAGD